MAWSRSSCTSSLCASLRTFNLEWEHWCSLICVCFDRCLFVWPSGRPIDRWMFKSNADVSWILSRNMWFCLSFLIAPALLAPSNTVQVCWWTVCQIKIVLCKNLYQHIYPNPTYMQRFLICHSRRVHVYFDCCLLDFQIVLCRVVDHLTVKCLIDVSWILCTFKWEILSCGPAAWCVKSILVLLSDPIMI